MRKKLLTGLCIALCLFTAACGAADPPSDQDGSGGVQDDGSEAEQSAFRLEMTEDIYPLTIAEIPYTIINETGETRKVVLVPLLEREEDGEWRSVDCTGIFCGTPDYVDEKLNSVLSTDFYPDLSAGNYRLTFQTEDWPDGESISDEFALK